VDGIVNEDWKDYISIIVFLFIVLGGLILIGSCNGGWAVAGWEITPSDSSNIFVSLFDQDSTQHSYKRPIHLDGDNWCYKHELWEMVRKNG
jgi:hypothetical protein